MIKLLKVVSFFTLLVVFSFLSPAKAEASWQDFLKEQIAERVDLNGEKIKLLIFKNSDFTQVTNKFQPNQLMHLKVEVAGSGEKQRMVKILDSRKKEVTARVLDQSGKGPFIYTATLQAPEKDGMYYLDIKIESETFSFASQESIMVGNVTVSKNISPKVDLKLPDNNSAGTSNASLSGESERQVSVSLPLSTVLESLGSFFSGLNGMLN